MRRAAQTRQVSTPHATRRTLSRSYEPCAASLLVRKTGDDQLVAFPRAALHPVSMRPVTCCLVLLMACGGKPAPEKTAPAPAAAAAPVVRTFPSTLHAIDVNGTRLAYRLVGDSGATPVVFIHGSLANLRSWSGQEAAFAQSYRVLVYSRRYHPPNPRVEDSQTYSRKHYAEDLAALTRSFDIAQAHVVGVELRGI